MTGRLIFAIISTLLEETAIVVILRWGLPELGVRIPLLGLIALMLAWAGYSVATYRMGSRALKKKPVTALPDMVGSQGVVVSPLASEGLVKIKGELWRARSESGEMKSGVEVIVVRQNGLKLVVCKCSPADDLEISE